MSTLGDGLRLAVGTFTRIPSGTVTLDARTARAALLLAPVAVLPLALLAGLVAAGVEVGLPPLVASGLADVVDALGALMVLLAVVLGLLAPTLLREKAVLGGISGDVLGAAVEVTLTTTLVVLTLAW